MNQANAYRCKSHTAMFGYSISFYTPNNIKNENIPENKREYSAKEVEAIDVKCQDDMYIHNEERTSYLEKLQFKNKERKKADIQINNREVINKRKKPG